MSIKNKFAMELVRALMVKTLSVQDTHCEYVTNVAIGDKRFILNEDKNILVCYDILMDMDVVLTDTLISHLCNKAMEKSIEVCVNSKTEEYEFVHINDESHLDENEIIAIVKVLKRIGEYEQLEYSEEQLLDIVL